MKTFGTCCPDMKAALTNPPVSTFHFDDPGILYLSVGYVQTPSGVGWFDQAVLFCPFCGVQLQTRESIARVAAV